MEPLGGRIRALRAERQLSLPTLAERAGVSKGLLSKLENATAPNPSIETIHKIAEALGVTVSDLIDSGRMVARRVVPDSPPEWLTPLKKKLEQQGKAVDEDILQSLYILQMRKGSSPKDADAWLYMYQSIEMCLAKSRK